MFCSRFLIIVPWLLAISCTVSQEQLSTFAPPEEISFKVIDGVNHSFEGSDKVVIQSTGANIQAATLYVKSYPYILNYELQTMAPMGDGRFETSLNFSADQVKWYIGASSGLGASTSFGTFNEPQVSEKYMKKTAADALIKDILNIGLSSANVFQTYGPNSTGNVHTYSFNDLSGNTQSVGLDHYTTLFQLPGYHTAYGIEYSTLVTASGNDDIPVTGANLLTERTVKLQEGPLQNFGYVIISTTDRGGLQNILRNSNFFPNIPAEESHLLNRLELIRY
jgi:hypothetical protein